MQKHITRILLAVGLSVITANAQNTANIRIEFSGYTGAGITETLYNFPALVKLSNGIGGSTFSFGGFPFADPNGYDLRFYDEENNLLDHEIDLWDTSDTSYIWVKVPEIKPDGSSFITAAWGDVNNTEQLPCTTNGAVWADGYRLVQHYTDFNLAGSDFMVADSTSAKTPARLVNASGIPVDSIIGKAVDLTQTARTSGIQVITPIPSGTAASGWTVSSWFKGLRPTGDYRTLTRSSGSHHHILVENNSGRLGSWLGSFNPAGSATLVSDNTAPFTPVWRHIMVAGTNNTTTFYIDGEQVGVIAGQSTENIQGIGFHYSNGSPSQQFADYLDEFRVAGTARPANWAWAEFMNQGSNTVFATYSNPSGEGTPFPENSGVESIEPEGAVFTCHIISNGATYALTPDDTCVYLAFSDEKMEDGDWIQADGFVSFSAIQDGNDPEIFVATDRKSVV